MKNKKNVKSSQKVGLVVIIFVAISPFLTNAQQLYISPDKPKISQMFRFENGNSNLENEGIRKIWVFFTDKGISTQKEYLAAIQNPNELITKRSLKRREKNFKTERLVDFYDLPVLPKYISMVSDISEEWCTTSRWLNGMSVKATWKQITKISKLPFVRRIQPVSGNKVTRTICKSKTTYDKKHSNSFQHHLYDYGVSFDQLNITNVPAVHDVGLSGEGVLICILDVGFNNLQHEALKNINILNTWDFVDNDDTITASHDEHGTIVLSCCGGYKSGKLIGSAFGASFVLARTEDADSEFLEEEDYWQSGVEWADYLGADIVSSSLANMDGLHSYSELDGNTTVASIAARRAASLGILICNAIGNSGSAPGSLFSPADADSILTVGAVTSSGTVAGFSSRGPTFDGRIKPEVMAAGVWVYSATVGTHNAYTRVSGTSLATPITAGIAALVKQNHPDWGPMKIREALMKTASQSENPDNNYGWGIIDAMQAVFYESIGGVVSDSITRVPLENAQVVFTGPVSGTSITNYDGRFIIENLQSGTYSIYVQYQGYEDHDATYQVPPWTGNADLKMIPNSTGIKSNKSSSTDKPGRYHLEQNYPNPFNPKTTIKFSIPVSQYVILNVYNIQGKKIKTLIDEFKQAGNYQINFNADEFTDGVYFYRMQADNFVSIKKMILLR